MARSLLDRAVVRMALMDRTRERLRRDHPPEAPIIPPPWPALTAEEVAAARPHPPCIVDQYLYADLAVLCAPGGAGKTTLCLWEAVHIALGRPVWGLRVWTPGATLILTAEDSRELLAARLRAVMDDLGLSPYERGVVLRRIAVWDVSGETLRLAELDPAGNIRLTGLADAIVTAYRDDPPVMVVIDPVVSFGPGERHLNDAAQAVVIACRRIIRGLGCCVRLVSHVGQTSARARTTDQYVARGGTALPDGARMVTVLTSAHESAMEPPAGWNLGPGDGGLILTRAKLSYAPPQPPVWIRRRGYTYDHWAGTPRTPEDRAEARRQAADTDVETLAAWLAAEEAAGRRYSARQAEAVRDTVGLSRDRLRAAIARAETAGRIVHIDLPAEERSGGRTSYLAVATARDPSRADSIIGPSVAPLSSVPAGGECARAAYIEKEGSAHTRAAPLSPSLSCAARTDRALAAHTAHTGMDAHDGDLRGQWSVPVYRMDTSPSAVEHARAELAQPPGPHVLIDGGLVPDAEGEL